MRVFEIRFDYTPCSPLWYPFFHSFILFYWHAFPPLTSMVKDESPYHYGLHVSCEQNRWSNSSYNISSTQPNSCYLRVSRIHFYLSFFVVIVSLTWFVKNGLSTYLEFWYFPCVLIPLTLISINCYYTQHYFSSCLQLPLTMFFFDFSTFSPC